MSVPPQPGQDGQPNPFAPPEQSGTPAQGLPAGHPGVAPGQPGEAAGQPGVPGQPGPIPGQPGAAAPYGPPPGQPAYAQSAPGGPPYGPPPGQPGAYPPGAFGPPPGVPVQRAKRSKWVWLRIAIPVVVVVVAVITGIISSQSSPDRAAVGECLSIKEFKDNVEPKKVDCTDQTANVKIAVRLEDDVSDCPAGDYDKYWVEGDNSYKLCLMPNVREGECLSNVTDLTKGYQRVDCGDPAAEVRIVKVITGTADESACQDTDADAALKYSQPSTTFCLTDSNHA
ncbi:hypothetical protein FHX82_001678 [Amycolatopsis bartoniae]|uniref:LppU/SCO3897 family protein n=1 Tax=Amycolatopsis bartoniae TaxID=941986 RepID=UPI00118F1489|nr:hypothetical protein [Amycolatopsis bartoniae]MBB2934658.1 hypothetical protein [Amycolatopsis bartoniae]TVT09320.1 hypothetical protein FNH07_09140 [Amycolatopsis bartoniae]